MPKTKMTKVEKLKKLDKNMRPIDDEEPAAPKKQPIDVIPPIAPKFRWMSPCYHMTYKTHVPLPELAAFIGTKFHVLAWSGCHELGHHDREVDNYPHTHFMFLRDDVDVPRGCDVLDYPCPDGSVIHPNAKGVRYLAHRRAILDYHQKEHVHSDGYNLKLFDCQDDRVVAKSVLTLAKSGRLDEIQEHYPEQYLRYHYAIHRNLPYMEPDIEPSTKIAVILIHGPPNTGKSFKAIEIAEGKFPGKWFQWVATENFFTDMSSDTQCLIISDLSHRKFQANPDLIKTLSEPGLHRLPRKHKDPICVALRCVIITTNATPSELFGDETSAMMARVHRTIHLTRVYAEKKAPDVDVLDFVDQYFASESNVPK